MRLPSPSEKNIKRLYILSLLIFISIPFGFYEISSTRAGTSPDCVGNISADYLKAKTHYQNELHDLITKTAPDLTVLAGINRDLQVALAEDRHARLLFLLASNKERIVTDKGMSRFSNFDWNAGDQKSFLKVSANHQSQTDRITKLKEKNNNHPDWPRMRNLFREKLFLKPEYQAIQKELTTQTKALGQQLKRCQ